jgi:hypothetical protein
MKAVALCSFLLFLLAPSSVRSQPGKQPVTPNVYELKGGQMHIRFSTTSKDGQPYFSYEEGSQSLSFKGSQIRQVKAELGTLVSVTIHMTVDAGSTTFTLLLPKVNLAEQNSTAQIHTIGITTTHRFSVVPAFNHGQTEIYTTTELSGTGSLVAF